MNAWIARSDGWLISRKKASTLSTISRIVTNATPEPLMFSSPIGNMHPAYTNRPRGSLDDPPDSDDRLEELPLELLEELDDRDELEELDDREELEELEELEDDLDELELEELDDELEAPDEDEEEELEEPVPPDCDRVNRVGDTGPSLSHAANSAAAASAAPPDSSIRNVRRSDILDSTAVASGPAGTAAFSAQSSGRTDIGVLLVHV